MHGHFRLDRGQKALTVAKLMWEVFVNYGLLQRLHFNQGRDFEEKITQGLCKFAETQKPRTTPTVHRVMGEQRGHKTLLSMLATLEQENKSRWPEYLSPLVYAYNCMRVDHGNASTRSYPAYAKSLCDRLLFAYEKKIATVKKLAARSKQIYDSCARLSATCIQVSDHVLVRNLSVRGKHKLGDRWGKGSCEVVECFPGLPVYKIRSKDGKVRILHCNLLLPFKDVALEPAGPLVSERTSLPQVPSRHSRSATEE